jgi:PPP family 3-phenylpropionic acid transporter
MRERHFGPRISLVYLTSFLVLGVFVPFFPLWLKTRGLSSQEIAIAMAAPMAARIMVVPIMTLAADRMGDRRLCCAWSHCWRSS